MSPLAPLPWRLPENLPAAAGQTPIYFAAGYAAAAAILITWALWRRLTGDNGEVDHLLRE